VYQESEIVDLLMVLFLTPVMAASLRSIHLEGRNLFIVGYFAVVVGFVFTIAEGFWLPDVFNALEHASYGVAGVVLAVASFKLMRSVRSEATDS